MNEEEKKAVIQLKGLENDKEHLIIEQRQAITTILSLIEKQQKEIERLKNFNKNTYIRKDTIRKKLEEIENSDTISIIGIYDFFKKISGE